MDIDDIIRQLSAHGYQVRLIVYGFFCVEPHPAAASWKWATAEQLRELLDSVCSNT